MSHTKANGTVTPGVSAQIIHVRNRVIWVQQSPSATEMILYTCTHG